MVCHVTGGDSYSPLITGGDDYDMMTMNLHFPIGTGSDAMLCMDVNIIDDNISEGDETFTVLLTTLSPNVTLGNAVANITITDNYG